MTTTVEAAEGQWDTIYNHYGLSPSRRHSRDECPFCGSKNSFRIAPERIGYGGWICKCGAGNGFQLLQEIEGKTFAEIAKEVDDILGRTFKAEAPKPRKPTAIDKWAGLSPLKGTDGEKYLISRGIRICPKRGVKFGYEYIQGKQYGCIYAVAVNSQGEPCYLHQTFLDGDKKAVFKPFSIDGDLIQLPTKKVTTIKQTDDSVAIRLDWSDKVLGISEGLESSLSAQQRFKIPAFGTMSTAFMKRFKAPPGVETLMIFADSDKNGAGHAAAFTCANLNMTRKNDDLKRVIVRWPKNGDYNDSFHSDLFEWQFNK